MPNSSIFYQEEDQIFDTGEKLQGGKWYFWDRGFVDFYGPFDSFEQADKEAQRQFDIIINGCSSC